MEDLLAKYGTLAPLDFEEESAFRTLATIKRDHAPGTSLVDAGDDGKDHLYIVESGNLFASCDLPNGNRAITRLYFAGDIVGTANVPFEHATQSITVQSQAVLYPFPRANLIDAFTRLPRLAAIFYTFAALENAVLNDRLVSIGRMRGIARLASLILEIASRRNLFAKREDGPFPLGLTQVQIGDAIGLTVVQVNRLFRELDSHDVIERSGDRLRIVDYAGLKQIGLFRDRYADLDLDWFDRPKG